MTPVNKGLIPTGEVVPVKGTPFDFTTPWPIGARIKADNEQLRFGGGYDHNWVLNNQSGKLAPAAALYEKTTGRYMRCGPPSPRSSSTVATSRLIRCPAKSRARTSVTAAAWRLRRSTRPTRPISRRPCRRSCALARSINQRLSTVSASGKRKQGENNGYPRHCHFCGSIAAVIGVGLWKSKSAQSQDSDAADYFLAGRGLTWWLIASR